MPQNDAKPKTLNYRRCCSDNPADRAKGETFILQDLLLKASKTIPKPWKRPVGISLTKSQFLAHLVHKQGCLCGTLVLSEKDRLIPLVDFEDGRTWEGTSEPKDDSGKKRPIQEQALYFAVKENHVAVIQTKELSIGSLTDFLTWMIQSKAELAEGWVFELQNLPSKTALEKLKDRKIKGISFGRKAFDVIREEIPKEHKKSGDRKKYNKHVEMNSMAMDFLKAVLGNNEILQELSRSEDPGNIYLELQISYRSRSEKDSQELMRALAAIAGDNPDVEPEIQLEGRSKIRGKELTIIDTVKVQAPMGNVSADDAMTRLAEWLNCAIKSGKVIQ